MAFKLKKLRQDFVDVNGAVFELFRDWCERHSDQTCGCMITYTYNNKVCPIVGVVTIECNKIEYSDNFWSCVNAFVKTNKLYWEE